MEAGKKVGKIVGWAIAGVFLLIVFFNSFYTIGEQEQAVVVTFGKATAVSEPGLHVKAPFIQHVVMVDTTIKGMAIGYNEKSNTSIESESLMITSDYNFVNVDFYLEYKVSDTVKYLYASNDPKSILKNISQGCIRSVIGTTDVDSVITTGKGAIQSQIKEEIIKRLDREDIGLQLVNITIQDAEPPTSEVVAAFKEVETAKQGMETAVNNANKYKNEKTPEAEAEVDKILKTAEAEKQARINEAKGQAARFEALYSEYRKYPLITKQRMYFETMQDILPGLEVIIDDGSGNIQKMLPLSSFMD